jgi:hypothetical protein
VPNFTDRRHCRLIYSIHRIAATSCEDCAKQKFNQALPRSSHNADGQPELNQYDPANFDCCSRNLRLMIIHHPP